MIMMIKTLQNAATLLPYLSTMNPMKKHPRISPTPNKTIANSAFLFLSFFSASVSSGKEDTEISAKTPEKKAILIPVQNN